MKLTHTRFALPVMVSLFLTVVATTSWATTIRYDYDRGTDFSTWRTFAWAPPVNPTPTIEERRLARAVDAGFLGRGYRLTAAVGDADFLVEYQAAAWRDVRLETSFRGPYLGRTAQVVREPRGALVIRVVDRRTGRLVWHGMVADELTADRAKADQRTMNAVAKLLKKFPVQGGGK